MGIMFQIWKMITLQRVAVWQQVQLIVLHCALKYSQRVDLMFGMRPALSETSLVFYQEAIKFGTCLKQLEIKMNRNHGDISQEIVRLSNLEQITKEP